MSRPADPDDDDDDGDPPSHDDNGGDLALLFQALQTTCSLSTSSPPLAACLMLDRWGYALGRPSPASGVPLPVMARKAKFLRQSQTSLSLANEIDQELLGSYSLPAIARAKKEPYLYDIRRLPVRPPSPPQPVIVGALPTKPSAAVGPSSRPSTHLHFSECSRFAESKAFYARTNEAAFESIVPYGVTTNKFIVDAYARVVLAYLADVQGHYRSGTKVYIVELAAGHCLFGYMLAKRLREEKQTHWGICVVLTDFNQTLLESRMKTAWMEPLVSAGWLDFATLDASLQDTDESSLELLASKIRIAPGSVEGPVFVVGNYALDSFPVDIFLREQGGGLLEVVEDTETNQTILAPVIAEGEDAYPYKELLQALEERGKESVLHVINIGFLNILRRIKSWLHPSTHQGHLALILADGVFQHDDSAWQAVPADEQEKESSSKMKKIILPDMSPGPGSGCFALASDPEALAVTAEWVLESGAVNEWLAVRNTVVEGSLTVMLLATGGLSASLPRTRKAFWHYLCAQNPTDFEHLQGLVLEEDGTEKDHLLHSLGLPGMLALLRWSAYDGDLFLALRWPLRDALLMCCGGGGNANEEAAVVQTTLCCLANRAVLSARAWQQTRYWGLQFLYALGKHREVLEFFLRDAGRGTFAGVWDQRYNDAFGSAAEAFLVARSLEKEEGKESMSSDQILTAVLADVKKKKKWRDEKGQKRIENYLKKNG